jgi:hypothetical protein
MGLFSGGTEPSKKAMPYLNQIPQVAQQNLGPWQQQGQEAQLSNQQQYNRMTNNPGDFLAELKASYTPSAGYKFRQEEALKAARAAASSGGIRGTPANQAAQAKLVSDLLGEDEGAHIERLLGIHGMGLQGNENIANRGFGASGDIANINATNLSQQGSLAYKGQQNKNSSRAGLMKALATLAGAAVGSVGGPAGAAAGANIAGGLVGGGEGSGGSDYDNWHQFGQGLSKVGSGSGGSPSGATPPFWAGSMTGGK